MNEIPITNVINIDEPKEYKLHAACWNGEDQPLDVYVKDKRRWRGWNTYRKKRNDFSRKYIFSMMEFYHENDMWLFGGIYEVLERKSVCGRDSYVVREMDEYSGYVGRLKIKLKRPGRSKAFLLEKHLSKMSVSEILKRPYSGEVFPGYENINHDFEILEPIWKNENKDWKAALKNVKGVYVIMDKSNGKKYVGSAYGGSGIWSRWNCYIETRHGGNDELTRLIKRKGPGYARKNFRLSLLEYRPMKTDDKVIVERENFWKEVFLSRGEFGYNKN